MRVRFFEGARFSVECATVLYWRPAHVSLPEKLTEVQSCILMASATASQGGKVMESGFKPTCGNTGNAPGLLLSCEVS